MPLLDLIRPLLLTEVCELPVAYLFGYRTRAQLLSVFAVNLLTNPILNYLLWLNYSLALVKQTLPLVLFLEILVVIGEAALLAFAWHMRFVKLLPLALAINLASYLAGLVIL